jgi:hypothetical protein
VGSFGDNGGWPHDGGPPDDLPDLPEEWGVIVIPDDLSELSDEVRAVQAELAVARPETRWQRFAARPGVRRLRRLGSAGVRAPVLIISMAVLVTIASLFASAWPGPARSPATQRTANTTDERGGSTLPALEMVGPDGQTVALRGQLPAVVLLTDGCACAQVIADTITAVRPEIAVVTVSSATPAGGNTPPTGATPQAQGKIVRNLSDPTSTLRSHLDLEAPDGSAAVLLVNRGGEIVHLDPHVTMAEVFEPELSRL